MGIASQPYLVAVSGGIDSMVLLHMLHSRGLPIVIAHVDHGIREDSYIDAHHVEQTAATMGVPFVTTQLSLGPKASEDKARQERHAWLREQQRLNNAKAIVTAHHADDLVETMIFNIYRGTGWRGIASLQQESNGVIRPLLHINKAQLVRYAIDHELSWREDSTNDDVRYARNYIRHGIVPRLSHEHHRELRKRQAQQVHLRKAINIEARKLIRPNDPLSRHLIIMSPDIVAEELLIVWLGRTLERPHLRRLIHFTKTAPIGAKFTVGQGEHLTVSRKELFVPNRED